jgi:hypothetical protein
MTPGEAAILIGLAGAAATAGLAAGALGARPQAEPVRVKGRGRRGERARGHEDAPDEDRR